MPQVQRAGSFELWKADRLTLNQSKNMKTQDSKDYSQADYHSRRFKVCDLPKGLHDLEEVEVIVTYTGEGSARKGIAVDSIVVPLFKAAPYLLEALKGAVETADREGLQDCYWYADARAAITKANREE